MPRNREVFDRPHEGAISSAPADVIGKMMYLNDSLERLMNELEAVERGLVGSPAPMVSKTDPRIPPEATAPAGYDGLVYQIDLALTRATACLGQADSNARPFRRPNHESGMAVRQ